MIFKNLLRRTTQISSICAIVASVTMIGPPAKAESRYFSSYTEFSDSKVPGDILWKVLARSGDSKRYDHVLALDGGTIGVANFAVGGLASLYKLMDTQRYFGRPRSVMIADYSSKCRPSGRRGNDRGWGCYSKKWWREGMKNFVSSPESAAVQNAAWLNQMKPTVKIAMRHGWNSSRELAIATGVANSVGSGGFIRIANKYNWNSEEVLKMYAGKDPHRIRRKTAINSVFPR